MKLKLFIGKDYKFLDKDLEVHHINHTRNDNRIENLQLVTKTNHNILDKVFEDENNVKKVGNLF